VDDNIQNGFTKYSSYLEELRSIIFFLTKIFILVFFVGFFSASPLIKFIMNHINIQNVTIVTTSPFQLIELAMSFGFFFSCIVIIPIFIYRFYIFLKPGLLPKERKSFIFSLPLALLLFSVGFIYGGGMLYYGVKLIAKVNIGLGVANYWDISTFISQIVLTASLLGLLFIFPLIISFLIKIRVLSVQFLKSKRKHAIVIIFIIVSLLPPTDGLSLILMAVPLLLIFELTILVNRKSNSGRHLIT